MKLMSTSIPPWFLLLLLSLIPNQSIECREIKFHRKAFSIGKWLIWWPNQMSINIQLMERLKTLEKEWNQERKSVCVSFRVFVIVPSNHWPHRWESTEDLHGVFLMIKLKLLWQIHIHCCCEGNFQEVLGVSQRFIMSVSSVEAIHIIEDFRHSGIVKVILCKLSMSSRV